MKKIRIRTIHRFLGVIIGIQLLLWTTSGMIFSWNPINKVRGEHLVAVETPVDLTNMETVSVQELIQLHRESLTNKKIAGVQIRTLLSRPVLELAVGSESDSLTYRLYDAVSGEQLSPIPESLAREIAMNDFSLPATVVNTQLITNVHAHSEYRGKELPAWRVTLDHATGTVIYVSANRGLVTSRRNNRWRLFDFFWMLHTMDFQGRDNFNHWLLRSFSALGVVTVFSGYWLWWRSSRLRRRIFKKRKDPV